MRQPALSGLEGGMMKKEEPKKPTKPKPGTVSTFDSGGGGTTNPPEPGKPTKPGS